MTRRRQALAPMFLVIGTLACYDEDQHLPTEPGTVKALSLTASPSTIPADGFSRTTITATIDPRTDTANREVTFDTTGGSFVGATPTNQAKVKADVTGTATADLRSSRDVGDVIVTATAGSITRTIHVTFTAADPSATIRASTSATTAPADNASITQVIADIAPELPETNREITFTTTIGSFVATQTMTAKAKADGSNRAIVDLKSPAGVGTARLTATVNDVTAETLLRFVPAPPDSIQLAVEPDMLDLKATDVVAITATLHRITGSVTDGLQVTYTALGTAGDPVGAFFNPLPSANGESTVRYTPNGTAYRGQLTIRATAEGSPAVGELTLRIVDP